MSQHVLLENGTVISVQTLQGLTEAEIDSPLEQSKRNAFDKANQKLFCDDDSPPVDQSKRRRQHDGVKYINEDNEVGKNFGNGEKIKQATQKIQDNDRFDCFNAYVNTEILMPQNWDVMQSACVIGCSTDEEGNPIGQYDPNPMLNTRVFDIMFPNGANQQYLANVIAESLYENSDAEDGYRYQLIDVILDHQKINNVVKKANGIVVSKNGQSKKKIITKGWKFLIR